jgi:hypothetical protein
MVPIENSLQPCGLPYLLHRHSWEKLRMPLALKQQVEKMAKAQSIPLTLTVASRIAMTEYAIRHERKDGGAR